jgi:hypothetical protein
MLAWGDALRHWIAWSARPTSLGGAAMRTTRLASLLAWAALVTQACTDTTRPGAPPRATSTSPARPLAADEPPTPHVWVHYDYLVYPDGHDDAPDPAAIQEVVDAFAAHGVVLEIDNHHTAIPTSNKLVSMIPLCGALVVADVRSQYFHPTSNHEWHYALFGDRVLDVSRPFPDPCAATTSGFSEENGDNFALGMEFLRHFQIGNDALFVGGAFMHELGHNLGLLHGGNDDLNYKPNYISVMNYFFNFGIPYAKVAGSTAIAGYRLDYSGPALPPLDPAHLDETVGVQGSSPDIVRFVVGPDSVCFPRTLDCREASGPAKGPIDWNLNGTATETDVAVPLFTSRATCLVCPPPGSPITGFDDWAEVRGYVLGTIAHGPKAIAPEDAAEQPVVTGISPTTGPAAGGTAVTITGTHLRKATQVVFGAAGPARSFQVVGENTIVAISPPNPYPTGAPRDVTVISGLNPSPSVAADVFTYPDWPKPVVRGFSPAGGPLGGGIAVTISGSGLLGASAVNFGSTGAEAYHVLDDSTIVAVSPPSGVGAVSVSVTTLGGTGYSSSDFIYLGKPVVYAISPTAGFEAGGTSVTIEAPADNSYLTGITGVSFGRTPAASFSQPVLDAGRVGYYTVTAVAPPGTGTVDVTITDPGGTSATVPADVFTYWPTARITAIGPSAGSAGTVVTIAGENLGAATGVFFGPVNALSFTVIDNSTIQATVPALAAGGALEVWASTPGGATNTVVFTYQ